MTNEFFPPTETELEEMIFQLNKKLEDEHYREDWPDLAEQLAEKKEQLRQLIIKNNAL